MAIKTEDFDVPTPPALPTGFIWGSSLVTTASPGGGIVPISSPNVLALNAPGNNTTRYGTYGTADSNGGAVSVSCYFNAVSTTNNQTFGVTFRGGSNDLSQASQTYYWAQLSPDFLVCRLYKVVSGTQTLLQTVGLASLAVPEWYLLTATDDAGNNIAVSVQRQSDGHWLSSSGSFQSAQTTAISVSDGSITGSGYAGLTIQSRSDDAYADHWVFANFAASSSGSLAATESHDVGALVGFAPWGTLSVAERGDTGAIAGANTFAATAAAVERHDAGNLASVVETAILTRQEGPDVAAIPAGFAAPASLAAAEGPDLMVAAGAMVAGVLAATERRDTASAPAAFAAVAAMAATEHPDSGRLKSLVHNTITLAATESPDVAALAGATAVAGHMAYREGRDVGSLSAATAITSVLAAAEAGDRGAISAFGLGVPPFFQATEGPDVAAILGGTPTVQYHVYANAGVGDPIDYATPVATVGATTWTSSTLACPGTWKFGVRAFDDGGEEQNLDCAVTIVFDAQGNDITNRPAPPSGLRAFATPGGGARVEWWYGTTTGPKTPSGFHVYIEAGTSLSYAAPAGTVAYSSGRFNAFVFDASGLSDGVLYTVGVRAFNATAEEPNRNTVTVTAVTTGPAPVVGLAGLAVV